MAAIPSPVPTRNPSGATTDAPFGPMADSGYGNPAFYHQFMDDFDNSISGTGLWTITAASGSVAQTPGDGGIALFTTGATSGNFAEIQLPAADFTIPQSTLAGKKLFFGARIPSISSLTSNVIIGLCNTTATPFAAVNDGVYFWHPTGGAVLNLLTVVGGTTSTWTIPAAAYTLATGTQIDMAFYIDRYQNINVFVGSQLFGYMPQSGTGAVNSVSGVSQLPVVGRCLQVVGPGQVAGGAQVGPWTVTSANLNPTFAIQTQSAAAITMQLDFGYCQKER